MNWWWSLPAHSKSFLLAGQQWLEWSHRYLSSNWLKWVSQSQSSSICLSTDEWVLARIEDHRKAYSLPLLMPNTCHSLWHRFQCRAWELASSTSKPAPRESFWCQNGLLQDCRNDGWLVLSGWPWAQKISPGGEAHHQLFHSLFGLVFSILKSRNWSSTVPAAGALYYKCWPNKVLH